MRKLAIWVFILVLLPALLAAAAYGFYWYQVKSFADRMAEQALPFARVEYASVYAHPLGEVGVDNVAITLTQDGTRIPIQSIRVRSQDPLFFFNPQGRIDAGDWPRALSVAVRQAQISLASPVMKTLEAQSEQATSFLPGGVNLDALACGEVSQLGIPELRKIGYSSLTLDMALALEVVPQDGHIAVRTDFDLPGVGNSSATIELSVSGHDLAPAQMLAANPRLRRLEVTYQDGGYNVRRNRFCAEQAGTDVATYRAEHERLMSAWLLEQGVRLPEPLQAAYNTLNAPRGQMMLVMQPPGGLGPEVMAGLGAPAELIERLNLSLRVNGQPVALDGIDWAGILVDAQPGAMARALGEEVPPEEMAAMDEAEVVAAESAQAEAAAAAADAQPAAAASADEDDLLRGMPKRAPKPEAKRYRETPLAQLGNLTGAPVRIRTDLGNRFEGRIVDVENRVLRIEQRVDRGLIIYPLDFEQIRSVEVYR
jgi:hypothetical protein